MAVSVPLCSSTYLEVFLRFEVELNSSADETGHIEIVPQEWGVGNIVYTCNKLRPFRSWSTSPRPWRCSLLFSPWLATPIVNCQRESAMELLRSAMETVGGRGAGWVRSAMRLEATRVGVWHAERKVPEPY